MEDLALPGLDVGGLEEGIRAARVEEGAAPGGLDRHHVRERRGMVERHADPGEIDLELLGLLDQVAPVLVVSDEADAVEVEGGLHPDEVDEVVVGAASALARDADEV